MPLSTPCARSNDVLVPEISPKCFSTIFWATSLAHEISKGIVLNRYRPKGELNTQRNDYSSVSFWCQYKFDMSTIEKTLQAFRVHEIVSKLGGLKSSFSMALFRSGGSKHNLSVLFAFSTITKLLTQITSSSTLAVIFKIVKSSLVFIYLGHSLVVK